MVGLPCSGKTTLAKKLETELGALRLTPDEWHRFLYGQDAAHPEHDERHSKIEALQWNIAADALTRGLDVILDFGLWTRAERDDFKQRGTALGAQTKIHYLEVSTEELFKRLQVRNSLASDDVTFIPIAMMERYLPLFEAPDAEELGRS